MTKKRVDARGKRHGHHSEWHAATIAFFHFQLPPSCNFPPPSPHARSQRRPSYNRLQRPTPRRIRSDLRRRYGHLLDTKRSGQGGHESAQTSSIERSPQAGSPAMRSTDYTLCFRPLRFGGGFSQGYPYTTSTGFSTVIWMGEA